ncbi:hypothetical protein GDO86_004633 [Hymenochirus boettgeri]|uniref:Chromo domain-containing protein n=1 Tax=Hymenochirus boettgeri TaxID=247094 RepID=A0A8T2K9H7_9PIPI|nr:hypothetical protein GDO86_004633 [Hymenochirus boettgeri]
MAGVEECGGGSSNAGGLSVASAGDGTPKTEAMESEQDDEDDVFEVESILDSKTEGSEVLYRVRWKGYDADGDTWEPEAHLDDCKEVLLEFRRKEAENKQKIIKKEVPILSSSDIFEADSESGKSEQKDESPPKKKKKREDEDLLLDEIKKKKLKSVKSKEKCKAELELPEDPSADFKVKKRLSESKEESNRSKEESNSKKPKKDEVKDMKKSKKDETKDLKPKVKEEFKEKKHKKEKPSESEPLTYERQTSHDTVHSSCADTSLEERTQPADDKDDQDQEAITDLPGEHLNEIPNIEDDDENDEVKMKKKKKKKHKKLKSEKMEETKSVTDEPRLDKKNVQKKTKPPEKLKDLSIFEKLSSLSATIPKSSRTSSDDKNRKSMDSLPEDKEGRKEKIKKKHGLEKEVKKEQKVVKVLKEPKTIFDAFTLTPEERNEITESTKIKEEISTDCRSVEDYKTKDVKPPIKESRSTRDESEPWAFAASEGDQEVTDPMSHINENSAPMENKAQVGLAMDLQLEWMTLEDFQRHLDGTDEITPTGTISYSALKDAVKNGDYPTVKYALNSKEEYNLEQEDSSGMTLVMMAAAAGQDDLLRLLIKKGAKINARQKNGTTALIHAAEKNYLTTVALLLDAGAYINVQQASGETALMKACKKGNFDIVRLFLEQGADCNMLSKHQSNALQFAKQSDGMLYDLIKSHLDTLSRVVEDAIKDYFETRLSLLEPIFPLACHRLCEGPDFSLDFTYKPPFTIPEGSGILLFVFHANFFGKEVVVRLCGPCSVQAVVLNDKFQLPVFLDAHFIYSFSPVVGLNKLFIRLSEVPSAKVKLLICAYRVQLPFV